jgi:exopolysaccharide biosynthesis polyprenyl glycosylphosphotransferase
VAGTRSSRQLLERLLDGLLFSLALGVAYLVRSNLKGLPEIEAFELHLWLFPFLALLGPTVLASQNFYDPVRRPTAHSRLGAAAGAALIVVVATIALIFIARLQYARSVILLAGPLGAGLAWLRSLALPSFTVSRIGSRQGRDRVLWVGMPVANARLRTALSAGERGNLENVGDFDPTTENPDAIVPILHHKAVSLVVFNLQGVSTQRLLPLIEACECEGVAILVRPGFLTGSYYGIELDLFAGEAVLHYRPQAASPHKLLAKEVIDRCAAALGLLFLSPLLALVALAIKRDSRGPVLFTQARSGINGRPFKLYKFRTMRPHAEGERAALAEQNEMMGPAFKLSNDPRITRIGRFLRRHSLDELPQLWNVLIGDMSLVGPRPLPTAEIEQIRDDAQRRRLSMKPGLTCLWQISGRNDIIHFDDWVRLDLAYIDRWSLSLDFRILLATIPVVLSGRGAS